MAWFSSVTTVLNILADIVGVLGAIFAFFTWMQTRQIRKVQQREQDRQNRKVTVTLQHGSDCLELPMELRRAELTRAEILGRLGMIPMKDKHQRFSLGHLNNPKFLRQINQIRENDGDADLIIPCTKEEFEQFDLDALKGDSNIKRRSATSPTP